MRIKTILSFVIGLTIANLSPASSATVYSLHDVYHGTTFVDGTITTNDSVGILVQSDIIAWNLHVTDFPFESTLTEANGTVQLVGNNLTATQTSLFWNYDLFSPNGCSKPCCRYLRSVRRLG